MGERLSAGVLVAEAAAGEELRRANVQHDELVDGLIRQAIYFCSSTGGTICAYFLSSSGVLV